MRYPGYPGYGAEVNAVLDVARAARKLEALFPETTASDVNQFLSGPAADWSLSLMDIILDYEEAESERPSE